jgi:hypothetical protein
MRFQPKFASFSCPFPQVYATRLQEARNSGRPPQKLAEARISHRQNHHREGISAAISEILAEIAIIFRSMEQGLLYSVKNHFCFRFSMCGRFTLRTRLAELLEAFLIDEQNLPPFLPLLRPCAGADLEAFPVSRSVNSPSHDAADCLSPVT